MSIGQAADDAVPAGVHLVDLAAVPARRFRHAAVLGIELRPSRRRIVGIERVSFLHGPPGGAQNIHRPRFETAAPEVRCALSPLRESVRIVYWERPVRQGTLSQLLSKPMGLPQIPPGTCCAKPSPRNGPRPCGQDIHGLGQCCSTIIVLGMIRDGRISPSRRRQGLSSWMVHPRISPRPKALETMRRKWVRRSMRWCSLNIDLGVLSTLDLPASEYVRSADGCSMFIHSRPWRPQHSNDAANAHRLIHRPDDREEVSGKRPMSRGPNQAAEIKYY